jgi:hypothetical protein
LQLEAKSLCEVMANPEGYAGRRILIKGTYFQEPEQRLLYDPHCPDWDVRVSHSLRVDEDPTAKRLIKQASKKDPTVNIPVVYDAIFTVSHWAPACSARECFHYSLEDAQLLAASPR